MIWQEVKNIKRSSSEIKNLRNFYRKKVRTKFIKFAAECGELNCLLTYREARKAVVKGKLPEDLTIHHKIPLSRKTGTNKIENLCVIPDYLHEELNKKVFEPQFNSGERTVFMPMFEGKTVSPDHEIFERIRERSNRR